ncbi:hypothetical protein [Effusibacillus consociatus]|uniref:Uncharacterized protein n=1 Tax=Effusibacillus consociatus TaxID=1117041 RepID=A0ABV9Q2B2_9BACL
MEKQNQQQAQDSTMNMLGVINAKGDVEEIRKYFKAQEPPESQRKKE